MSTALDRDAADRILDSAIDSLQRARVRMRNDDDLFLALYEVIVARSLLKDLITLVVEHHERGGTNGST